MRGNNAMVQFEELKNAVEELKPEIDDLADALGLKACESEIEQLEYKAAEPGFWDDTENSQKILQRTQLKIQQQTQLQANQNMLLNKLLFT